MQNDFDEFYDNDVQPIIEEICTFYCNENHCKLDGEYVCPVEHFRIWLKEKYSKNSEK